MAEPRGDEEAVLALIRPTPVTAGPGRGRSGTVREDDFDEAALDLDAIGRFGAVPAAVLVNRSDGEPDGPGDGAARSTCGPRSHPGDVRFSADTHMRLEFLLRVRDEAAPAPARASGPRPFARLHAPAAVHARCREARAVNRRDCSDVALRLRDCLRRCWPRRRGPPAQVMGEPVEPLARSGEVRPRSVRRGRGGGGAVRRARPGDRWAPARPWGCASATSSSAGWRCSCTPAARRHATDFAGSPRAVSCCSSCRHGRAEADPPLRRGRCPARWAAAWAACPPTCSARGALPRSRGPADPALRGRSRRRLPHRQPPLLLRADRRLHPATRVYNTSG